jgi:hypothetical protein
VDIDLQPIKFVSGIPIPQMNKVVKHLMNIRNVLESVFWLAIFAFVRWVSGIGD